MDYDRSKYLPGLSREFPYAKRAHLYEGNYSEVGLPMCRYGWNRDEGTSYSIWRNNVGEAGICKICLKRAAQGLPGVPAREIPVPDLTPEERFEMELANAKFYDEMGET